MADTAAHSLSYLLSIVNHNTLESSMKKFSCCLQNVEWSDLCIQQPRIINILLVLAVAMLDLNILIILHRVLNSANISLDVRSRHFIRLPLLVLSLVHRIDVIYSHKIAVKVLDLLQFCSAQQRDLIIPISNEHQHNLFFRLSVELAQRGYPVYINYLAPYFRVATIIKLFNGQNSLQYAFKIIMHKYVNEVNLLAFDNLISNLGKPSVLLNLGNENNNKNMFAAYNEKVTFFKKSMGENNTAINLQLLLDYAPSFLMKLINTYGYNKTVFTFQGKYLQLKDLLYYKILSMLSPYCSMYKFYKYNFYKNAYNIILIHISRYSEVWDMYFLRENALSLDMLNLSLASISNKKIRNMPEIDKGIVYNSLLNIMPKIDKDEKLTLDFFNDKPFSSVGDKVAIGCDGKAI